ncbi:uncharacterized protein LOC111704294, partial [Eurytemora carolleeae]|uniref:uncharacterized protein LOC111704294 n=1 Tax=Eurytemora carolleeae TaxID=1294199 RepID=UPI000C778236
EWSRYDFKSGVLQSLRSLGKKLIVILLGEIKLSDLDPELRCIVNSATLLNWGEHKFWEKVKFNLPERGDTGISQSTTLQSYPSTLHSFNSVLYQVPDLYEASPRYESAPGQPSLRPLLSPTSPDGLVSPGGVLTNLQTISRSKPGSVYPPATCLQNTFPHSSFRILHPVGDPSRDPTLLRDPCDLTQFRPPAYGTRTLRNQNLYSAQTNPRHIDHIYQVCM